MFYDQENESLIICNSLLSDYEQACIQAAARVGARLDQKCWGRWARKRYQESLGYWRQEGGYND